MAGRDDDDEATLIADELLSGARTRPKLPHPSTVGSVPRIQDPATDESTDDGATLVASFPESEDATVVAPHPGWGNPRARAMPRGPLPPPAPLPRSAPTPRPPPPSRDVEEALERRALPFAVGQHQPFKSDLPPGPGFVHTQELQAPLSVTQPPPLLSPVAKAPSVAPPAPVTGPAPAIEVRKPISVAPGPAVPRPPLESVIVPPPEEGTPPVVIRFLLVSGIVTAVGLLVLIYLEL